MKAPSEEPRPRWSKSKTFAPSSRGGGYPYAVVPRPAVAVEVDYGPLCLWRGQPPAAQELAILGTEGHVLIGDAELPGCYELFVAGPGG